VRYSSSPNRAEEPTVGRWAVENVVAADMGQPGLRGVGHTPLEVLSLLAPRPATDGLPFLSAADTFQWPQSIVYQPIPTGIPPEG
jgi:hypothetical protein